MNNTPKALRRHVLIIGNVNSGKSSLFNKILGQNAAIISDIPGTSTDPLLRQMELSPFGAITIIDSPGLGDATPLGPKREEKTRAASTMADFFIYLLDGKAPDFKAYSEFAEQNLSHILVISKADILSENDKAKLIDKYPETELISIEDSRDIASLKIRLSTELLARFPEEKQMLSGLIRKAEQLLMIVKIDSAAPKSRLILPQQMLISECVRGGIFLSICTDENADEMLKSRVFDLIVIDSQIFPLVKDIIPAGTPLTSFSLLLARKTGFLKDYIKGISAISKLSSGDRILMLEGCTHNISHEDIGRVKIPQMLRNYTKKSLDFSFYSGHDIPDNLTEFSLIILCGGCMLGEAEKNSRMKKIISAGVPSTNYGVILAFFSGELDKCSSFLERGE